MTAKGASGDDDAQARRDLNPLKQLERKFRHARGLVWARLLRWPKILLMRFRRNLPRRLHVGCGNNRFEGWINADITADSELIVYMEKPLPFRNGSLMRVYSEHVIEHVPYEVAQGFLKEVRRVLAPGGVVRIATPDLETLVEAYARKDWRSRICWAGTEDYAFLRTRAQFLNVSLRWWGHRHVYDREELERVFQDAGFGKPSFPGFGESDHEDLRGLETRQDSYLIAEAIR